MPWPCWPGRSLAMLRCFRLEVQLKAAFWVGRIFAVPNHSKSSVRGADTKTQNVRAGLLNSGGVLHPCEHGLDFTHRTRVRSARFSETSKRPNSNTCAVTANNVMSTPVNHYEELQISRNADEETIHRVYRMMAVRFHPDNAKSGDLERFLRLQEAYETLSDPARRAQYDRTHLTPEEEALPIFELDDFTDDLRGEVNRRLGVLSVLYHRRRINGDKPGISMLDLERRMALPREYLDFA